MPFSDGFDGVEQNVAAKVRMFEPKGDPNAGNFFKVLHHLQKRADVEFRLTQS